MRDALRRDYANTAPMVFGVAPSFDEVMDTVRKVDIAANSNP
jgi:hypothetical protein